MARELRRMGTALVGAVLAACLLTGLAPLAGAGERALAAEPDTSAYATNDQLNDDRVFSLDENKQGKPQKVLFGLDDSGRPQEWYIAGQDPFGSGLVLIAAKPFLVNMVFNPNTHANTKPYDEDWGCMYDGWPVVPPEGVWDTHWGSSAVRSRLKECETSQEFFSLDEQERMMETTIWTEDAYNRWRDQPGSWAPPRLYATKDKLYLPYAYDPEEGHAEPVDDLGDFVFAGTNSEAEPHSGLRIEVDGDLFKNSHFPDPVNAFWTRTPRLSNNSDVLAVVPGQSVSARPHIMDLNIDARPVFRLSTAGVDFASAVAPVSSEGPQELGEAFTLRYHAGDDIGRVFLDAAGTQARMSDVPEGVHLVVQSDAGAWAKSVAGDMTILSSDVDAGLTTFEGCKVWLEQTDAENRKTISRPAELDAPPVTGGVGRIEGTTTAMECAPVSDMNAWTTCEDGATPVAAGSWVVRYKKTDAMKAGITRQVQVWPLSSPNITSGAHGTWKRGGSQGLPFKFGSGLAGFVGVSVDGVRLSASDFLADAEDGRLTLRQEFLKRLAAGRHKLEVIFEQGTAETSFTVEEEAEPAPTEQVAGTGGSGAPSTGGSVMPPMGDAAGPSGLAALALLAASGAVLAGAAARRGRARSSS